MEGLSQIFLLSLGSVFLIGGLVDLLFYRQMGDLTERLVSRLPESFVEDVLPQDPRGYNFRRGALVSGILFSIFGCAYIWVILLIA